MFQLRHGSPGGQLSADQLSRRVLLLADDNPGHANTVLDHIRALTSLSRHDVRLFNPRGNSRNRMLDLSEFDAVVIHYSLVCISDHYLAHSFREQIRQFKGLKVQFIQDEYRWVDRVTEQMARMGIDVLFTCLPGGEAEKVYRPRLPGVQLVATLTGYVPDELVGRVTAPHAERPLDVGYRSRELPFWLGDLARDKVRIAAGVLERAPEHGLKVDIAWTEGRRIYGPDWIDFMASCRATLGTGSGSSITDFDGSIETAVNEYLGRHPEAAYEEVHAAVLSPFEGNVRFDVVSPRIFEAIALRTALVQFPGEYSGVVRPGDHYIVLERDFSNFAAVAAQLRDGHALQALTERAYADVIAGGRYSYRAFVDEFDAVISGAPRRAWPHPPIRYHAARVVQRTAPDRVPMRLAHLARRIAPRYRPTARLLVDPSSYTRKALAAVRRCATRPGLAVLGAWLGDGRLRSTVPVDRLLEELLEMHAASLEVRAGVTHVSVRGSLVHLRTGRRAGATELPPPPWPERIESITWDHRAAGTTADAGGGLRVAVGEAGQSRFSALSELENRHPGVLRQLLTAALRPGAEGALPSATITSRLRARSKVPLPTRAPEGDQSDGRR